MYYNDDLQKLFLSTTGQYAYCKESFKMRLGVCVAKKALFHIRDSWKTCHGDSLATKWFFNCRKCSGNKEGLKNDFINQQNSSESS